MRKWPLKPKEKIVKIKKNIAIITLLTIISICTLMILDFIAFKSFNHRNKSYFGEYKIFKYKTPKTIADKYIYDINTTKKYRKTENKNSAKKPILLFGHTLLYGYDLEENETLSHNLAILTKRPIYNRVKPETNHNHMYYQLSNEDFYKIIPKPEYIFYFYDSKHIAQSKNKLEFGSQDIYYKQKKDKLIVYKKLPISKKSFLLAKINIFLFKNKFSQLYFKANETLFKKILNESHKEAEKHWGKNTRFIIVELHACKSKTEEKIIEDLKKEGFEVFELYKYINLKDKKYKNKNKECYNSLLWEETAKVLAGEFDL